MSLIRTIIFLLSFALLVSCIGRKSPKGEACQGWAIGDVVKLKIGSPEMVVKDWWNFKNDCRLDVVWTSLEGESEEARYPTKILKKVNTKKY